MIYAIIALLILIFSLWIKCSERQNPGITLARLEAALPFVGSLSTQREDAPLLQQPARDEAAQGGQAPRVQRSRQAQAEAPRHSDVTQRPAFRHVTWNASVVGGSLEEIPEDPRASALQSPRDSACDKEHPQQDGCAQNVDCSGHATLRNGSCRGATSLTQPVQTSRLQ